MAARFEIAAIAACLPPAPAEPPRTRTPQRYTAAQIAAALKGLFSEFRCPDCGRPLADLVHAQIGGPR